MLHFILGRNRNEVGPLKFPEHATDLTRGGTDTLGQLSQIDRPFIRTHEDPNQLRPRRHPQDGSEEERQIDRESDVDLGQTQVRRPATTQVVQARQVEQLPARSVPARKLRGKLRIPDGDLAGEDQQRFRIGGHLLTLRARET